MEKSLDIPEGVEVECRDREIAVRGPMGELARPFSSPGIEITVKGREVRITSRTDRRREKAMVGTLASHMRNMMTGVTRGWESKMKIVYSHFPMKLSVEGRRITIQNFLGSKSSRSMDIPEGIEVRPDRDEITVTGINKEAVGQFSGHLESLTRVTGYDRRVFQDGIYITRKASPRVG